MNKAIAPAIGITFLVQLLVFFIGIGNNVIVSRLLGPELLGIFATIIVIIEIVFRIVNPGLDTSAIYFISIKKYDFHDYTGSYFINSLVIISAGCVILFILQKIGSINIFSEEIFFDFLSVNSWAVLFYFFSFLLFEFGSKIPLGLQQFNEYNKIQFFKPVLLFSLLVISAWLTEVELKLILYITGISFLVPAIMYWRFSKPIKLKWHKTAAKESLGFGIKVMLGNLIQYLTYRTDILLIGFFLSGTDVGWYYVSVLLAERLLSLTQATSTVFLPSASSSEIQREKTPLLSRINFTVVFAGSVLIGITAYWFVPILFSVEYINSVLPLVLLLPGIISLSVSKILSADITSRGLPQYSLYVSMLNFVFNITFNLILIPKFGIVGAALSSSISYTAALIFQIYLYKKLSQTGLAELIIIQKGDWVKLKST